MRSSEIKPKRKTEVAREPVKNIYANAIDSIVLNRIRKRCKSIIKILLTRVECSTVDIPLHPHSGVAHRFDSGLEVNSSTFDLMNVLQRYNETWRRINFVFFRGRQVRFRTFHMSQINHFGARRWSATFIIALSYNSVLLKR